MLVCYALEDRSHWFILAVRRMRSRLRIRFSAGSVALWGGRGYLGADGCAPLASAFEPRRCSSLTGLEQPSVFPVCSYSRIQERREWASTMAARPPVLSPPP